MCGRSGACGIKELNEGCISVEWGLHEGLHVAQGAERPRVVDHAHLPPEPGGVLPAVGLVLKLVEPTVLPAHEDAAALGMRRDGPHWGVVRREHVPVV